jgi:4-hydroxy-2-oxoheptanedioate aldolase
MKNRLKELLKAGKPAIGTLLQLPSPAVAEVLAHSGYDWILIDAEHGPIDVETLHAMIRATAGTDTTPTVRVARNLDWLAKRVLDIGALGVMMPVVNKLAGRRRSSRRGRSGTRRRAIADSVRLSRRCAGA